MSREIVINKHEGNTHYSVSVIDSYGKEHHLGYHKELTGVTQSIIERNAQDVWANEVKPEVDLMAEAVKECIKTDKERGIEPNLD